MPATEPKQHLLSRRLLGFRKSFQSSRGWRWISASVLVIGLAWLTVGGGYAPLLSIREWGFDQYQRTLPRERTTAPAVIIGIDEASLDAYGQWPWPKTILTKLVDKLTAAEPAAFGADILFIERDNSGPAALRALLPRGEDTERILSQMPDPDLKLSESFSRLNTVLAYAGLGSDSGHDFSRVAKQPALVFESKADFDNVTSYQSLLAPNSILAQGASSFGLVTVEVERGIVRRIPLVNQLGNEYKTLLPLEMFRLVAHDESLNLAKNSWGDWLVSLQDLSVPLDRQGQARIYYSYTDPNRFISAKDIIEGNFRTDQIQNKLVLLGFTGLGLADVYTTPLGEREYGVEIHAQFLENLFDGQHPFYSGVMPWLEALLTLLLGIGFIVILPRVGVGAGILTLTMTYATLIGAGLLLFAKTALLLNAAGVLLILTMVAITIYYGEWRRDLFARKQAEHALQEQRIATARMTGEFDAARKIQLALLPPPESVSAHDERIKIDARLESAREVGGDLYDAYWLDSERLFFIVGDVSGKGLPASLCMAVTKALTKSSALTDRSQLAQIMTSVNANVSRENPQELFITAFSGVLNASTGLLEFCNAGHETPLLMRNNQIIPLNDDDEGGGPPLCVIEDFSYQRGTIQLQPGDLLCLLTDGVTEALAPSKEPYGRERLQKFILQAPQQVNQLVQGLFAEIKNFAQGTEQADDITIFCLQWVHGGRSHQAVLSDAQAGHCTIEARLENWQKLYSFCENYSNDAEIPHKPKLRLLLVLEELFLNTVNHGFQGNSDSKVEVVLHVNNERIEVLYSDCAPSFNPFIESKIVLDANLERRKIGGLGLVLLNSMCLEGKHEYKDGKNILSFQLSGV